LAWKENRERTPLPQRTLDPDFAALLVQDLTNELSGIKLYGANIAIETHAQFNSASNPGQHALLQVFKQPVHVQRNRRM
jgi:hypothetical protein